MEKTAIISKKKIVKMPAYEKNTILEDLVKQRNISLQVTVTVDVREPMTSNLIDDFVLIARNCYLSPKKYISTVAVVIFYKFESD